MEQRINSEVLIIVLLKPMNNPLGVSPSKGKQGTTRGKFLTLQKNINLYMSRYEFFVKKTFFKSSRSQIFFAGKAVTRMSEPQKLKRKANEDQYKFNLKL